MFANGASTDASADTHGGAGLRATERILGVGESAFRFGMFDFREPLGGSCLLEGATLIPIVKLAKLLKFAKLGRGADDVVEKILQIRRNKGNFNIGSLTSDEAVD